MCQAPFSAAGVEKFGYYYAVLGGEQEKPKPWATWVLITGWAGFMCYQPVVEHLQNTWGR